MKVVVSSRPHPAMAQLLAAMLTDARVMRRRMRVDLYREPVGWAVNFGDIHYHGAAWIENGKWDLTFTADDWSDAYYPGQFPANEPIQNVVDFIMTQDPSKFKPHQPGPRKP